MLSLSLLLGLFFVLSDVEIKAKWLKGTTAHTTSRLVCPSTELNLTSLSIVGFLFFSGCSQVGEKDMIPVIKVGFDITQRC